MFQPAAFNNDQQDQWNRHVRTTPSHPVWASPKKLGTCRCGPRQGPKVFENVWKFGENHAGPKRVALKNNWDFNRKAGDSRDSPCKNLKPHLRHWPNIKTPSRQKWKIFVVIMELKNSIHPVCGPVIPEHPSQDPAASSSQINQRSF